MNILYVSKIDGKPWSGPSYSVPRQIESQSLYDNVLWYNLITDPIPEGVANVELWRTKPFYRDLTSIPSGKIVDLPSPFSNPDLIIVEQGYPFAKCAIRKEIMRSGIPYIVVPRGELTKTAQSKKRIKKIIGNFVLGYYGFMKKAVAIQFLTKQEKKETSLKWYSRSLVIPNGTVVPDKINRTNKDNGIKCISIGRLEPYQKGLDLLINACAGIKRELELSGCTIDLYGSDQEGKLKEIKTLVNELGLKKIIHFHEGIFGEEKEKVLHDADVFLMTSRFEGHPTGLLEALAYSLPALVTTGSNMRTEIEATNSGWGAENSTSAIQKALLNMLSEIGELSKKSENAYNLALKYDWNHIAEISHKKYSLMLEIDADGIDE